MSVWNSDTYRRDIDNALLLLDRDKLAGKRVLVTGASGLICSAVVDLLVACNQQYATGITVYAAGRSTTKLATRFPDGAAAGVVFVAYDATAPVNFDFEVDYIIHGASNASPDKYVSEPVDTMLANIMGVHHLLQYAADKSLEKFLYVSSSEVYGRLTHGNPMREDEYGATDILSPRSAYPMGKRAAETLCVSYANQYGMDVSIVRPGHIYGPTAQASDNRVSSAFARQAAMGENIVMKSAGTQLRSYCHCIDCATATLAVLTRGENKAAYNISNKDSVITIRQMAQVIADVSGVQLIMELPTDAEKAAFNPMDNSSLNSDKLEALGWQGQFDAATGFAHTIKAIQEMQ